MCIATCTLLTDDISGISTGIVTVKITPLNRQLMMGNFQIPYSYLHSNVIMCIDVYCHIIDKMT